MDREELTPHLEELKRVLGDKVGEEELLKELDTYLNVYRVDVKSAKRGILKKHGAGDPGAGIFTSSGSISKKIGDLTGSETTVDILAKVVFAEKKSVQIKGSPRTIVSGILGDDTATASFTVWDGENCSLDKGAVYLFKNCYTKLWNDKVQINMGNRSVIQRENVEMATPERQISYSSSVAKVADLREGIGNVTVTVKIVSVESRNILVKGEPRVVFSGIAADTTGKVQFSAWSDFGLQEGETVCIKNAYIRAWKGIPQLNFGDRSEVSRVDDTIGDIDEATLSRKSVGEIVRNGGGIDMTVSGTVVDVRSGSGLIKRCPQCNRSILGTECLNHGTVEPVYDVRLKVVIDDGTGAMSAIIGREVTERLTGMTLKMAMDLAKARGEADAVARAMAGKVLLRHVRLTGNVMSDDYGPMMIVRDAEEEDTDIPRRAADLLKKVEEAVM